jgi:hypothetical protein
MNLFTATVPPLRHGLGAANDMLRKSAEFAARTGVAERDMLAWRLAPDMFNFARQLVIAADGVRGAAARLAGIAPPEREAPDYAVFDRGGDQTFHDAATSADLASYLDRAIDFLGALDPAAFDKAEDRPIVIVMGGRSRSFSGGAFLQLYVLPNFYFHVSTAYAILRHHGVPLGKRGYEGPPVYTAGVV